MPLDRQLHKEVPHGSIERIRALRAQGTDLEVSAWPGPGMALVLIELGADINAYRRESRHATALHDAADSGAETVVELLIIHGANPYLRNDYGETALELARRKGHLYVNSKPHAVIELWKSQIEEGKLNEEDPSIAIFDKETESRYEILSADEGDKHMLQRFYDAFRGTAEVVNPVPVQPAEPPIPRSLPATSSLAHSYAELARAKAEGVPNVQPSASSAYMDEWGRLRSNSLNGRYGRPDAPAPLMISGHAQVDTKRSSRHNGRGMTGTSYNQKSPDASSGEPVESEAKMTNNGNPWRRCVTCLDAAVEGACVPCGHMAFCMPCLKDIKSKNGACPICRAAINQVIRLYQV
ncbi:putative E3 ubiquitin-protein ligase XBOS34 [Panicum miliaceum]|uniref:E3 ubiquitin-protein ligase XBOS34 n=1 Tax=Panicum miliaceum TaxID=4540 RepID=A0A3L6QW75_PANMI|nr:putative E3 ubiquitin-protein ligase XBOS34 [Panicum miliaceum]